MISVVVVAALAILALITQAGVLALQRAYPAQGKMIEVAGATLNIVDIGPRDAAGPPIVMIHGASSNLEVMRRPLGDMLAKNHRVILIDRPGHGWSTRARADDSTPAVQGRMIDETLERLGVGRAIFVVHSWSGALGARMALDYPQRVAGLVMLAPVAYPWPGGVGWYNKVVTIPVVGPLLAHTITLPLGFFLTEPGARGVFLPQIMPDDFVGNTATPLLLRPRQFLANARDLVALKAAVAPCRKIKAFPELRSVVTKAIFAGRSTLASSGDRSPHRLSVRERRIRWRRLQRRGRARTRQETGSRRMEGKSAETICPPRRERGRSIGSTRPALRQHLRSARRLFRKIA
jgi:pimeloyl-ACP methyl ester carboxylesterase